MAGRREADGSRRRPRLYIFDMGGVVSRNVSVAAAIASRLGLSVDEFYAAAGASSGGNSAAPYDNGDLRAIQAGELDAAAFWTRLAARASRLFPAHAIRSPRAADGSHEDLWMTEFHPVLDAEVALVIRELKIDGFRVVCGTNTLASHYAVHRERGDYGCFDAVYASHLMRLVKPDEAFWLEILSREGAEPRDAFFIDDAEPNVLAAASLGMGTHLYRGVAALREALRLERDAVNPR